MHLAFLVAEAFVTFPVLVARSLAATVRTRVAALRTVHLSTPIAISDRADRLQWN